MDISRALSYTQVHIQGTDSETQVLGVSYMATWRTELSNQFENNKANACEINMLLLAFSGNDSQVSTHVQTLGRSCNKKQMRHIWSTVISLHDNKEVLVFHRNCMFRRRHEISRIFHILCVYYLESTCEHSLCISSHRNQNTFQNLVLYSPMYCIMGTFCNA